MRHFFRTGLCRRCNKNLPEKRYHNYFCPKCTDINQELGFRFRGRDHTREKVRQRDNWTCQDCGFKRTWEEVREFNETFGLGSLKGKIKSLDVHHLKGLCGKKTLKYDRISEIDNLITLCHKCHFNRPEHKSQRKHANQDLSNL